MDEIYQLKITLRGSKPSIWRRVLEERTATFLDLHLIIQSAMGWDNSHLYEFNVFGTRIADLDPDFDDDFGMKKLDASSITIGDTFEEPGKKFTYEYDFGDGWIHQIAVEKILPRDSKLKYPICIAGKMNCPPEDCGGIWGFYNLIEIMKDKKHPEYQHYLEWLGGKYDPEYFDKEEINLELESLRSRL